MEAQKTVSARIIYPISAPIKDTIPAQFHGGRDAMTKFIEDNIRYPITTVENRIGGMSVICFTVTKEGKIEHVMLSRGIDPAADREAVRAVKAMPKWIPATVKGKAINMKFEVAVIFNIEEELKWYNKRIPRVIIEDTQADMPSVAADDVLDPTLMELVLKRIIDPEKLPDSLSNKILRPRFKEGEKALQEYISANLNYPEMSIELEDQGVVRLRFIVTKDGDIREVKIIRGISPWIDKEAVRIINSMPKWISGQSAGVSENMYHRMEILFELTDELRMAYYNKRAGVNVEEQLFVSDTSTVKEEKIKLKNFSADEVSVSIPSFQGGNKAMDKFIRGRLLYPLSAYEDKTEGRVIVRFTVKDTGELADIHIAQGLQPDCDAVALRIVKAMPKWVPRIRDGKYVESLYSIPIIFKYKKNLSKREVKAPDLQERIFEILNPEPSALLMNF